MSPLRAAVVPLLLLACVALSACEEGVSPFIDAGRTFTVYGYLDTGRDTQHVRVIALRRRVDVPAPGPLDATVTTTDLETGETVRWRDSVVTFRDGSRGNVFAARFRPAFGHRYRLAVVRGDGATTTAVTRVPPKYEALIDPPVVSSFTARSVEQTVRWPGVVRRPLRVQVWYRLAPARPGGPFRDVAIPYLPEESGVAEGNRWRVLAQLSRDAGAVTKQLSIADLPALYGVGMKLSFADSSWVPPGGVFDPDILIEPGTFTNVEGGFGFFGAVAQLNAEWTLTRAATEAAGYPWPNP